MTFQEEFNSKAMDLNVSNNDKISVGVLKSLK